MKVQLICNYTFYKSAEGSIGCVLIRDASVLINAYGYVEWNF